MWKKTMLAAPEALKVDHFQLAGVLNGTGNFCTAMWETVPAAVTNYYLHQIGSDNLLLLLLLGYILTNRYSQIQKDFLDP